MDKLEITDELFGQLLPQYRANWRIAETQGWFITHSERGYSLYDSNGRWLSINPEAWVLIRPSFHMPDFFSHVDVALELMNDWSSLYRDPGNLKLWKCGIFEDGYVGGCTATTPMIAIIGVYAWEHHLELTDLLKQLDANYAEDFE